MTPTRPGNGPQMAQASTEAVAGPIVFSPPPTPLRGSEGVSRRDVLGPATALLLAAVAAAYLALNVAYAGTNPPPVCDDGQTRVVCR